MKKHWRDIGIIVLLICLWRLILLGIERIAPYLWILQTTYLGSTRWANFDGVHYLSIAHYGYQHYLEAFFPLYPIFMHIISDFFPITLETAGLVISFLSFVGGLILFWKLAKLEKHVSPWWSMIFLLVYPMSFFFAGVYKSSLYFFLAASTLYFMKTKRWFLAGTLGALASGTQLFGVLLFIAVGFEYIQQKRKRILDMLYILMIPLGLFGYMVYLFKTFGDPLAFYHVQPAFGAERNANTIILLPQVIWRYINIFVHASMATLQYWIAVFEFGALLLATWLIWRGVKQKISSSYLLYSLAVMLLPTMTGTLSSLPRYFLSAFPLFFVLGRIKSNAVKIFLAFFFSIGLILACSLFLQGYFVS